MNYATLAAAIESWTQNNDPVFLAEIPRFVQLAERQIYMEAKLPPTRKTTTGTATVGNRSLTLPTDYIAGKAVEITTAAGVVNLLPKAVEYITEMYPVSGTLAPPKFYAQQDATTLVLGPTPDLAYTVTFHYLAVPTSIVTATNTWLGDNFENLLLYASLLHAYIFMKGSADIMAYYKAAYDVLLAELKAVTAQNRMNDFR